MKVYFENVGRSKATWQAEVKGELTCEWLYKQVKPYLASRGIDFFLDEVGKGEIVVGGFRTVGTFRIEEQGV